MATDEQRRRVQRDHRADQQSAYARQKAEDREEMRSTPPWSPDDLTKLYEQVADTFPEQLPMRMVQSQSCPPVMGVTSCDVLVRLRSPRDRTLMSRSLAHEHLAPQEDYHPPTAILYGERAEDDCAPDEVLREAIEDGCHWCIGWLGRAAIQVPWSPFLHWDFTGDVPSLRPRDDETSLCPQCRALSRLYRAINDRLLRSPSPEASIEDAMLLIQKLVL